MGRSPPPPLASFGIADLAALAADPTVRAWLNRVPAIATDAIHRADATGTPVSLRVVHSALDRVADAFGTSLIQARNMLTAVAAALPTVGGGDSFTLGADILTIQHAERDAAGNSWRILCQR